MTSAGHHTMMMQKAGSPVAPIAGLRSDGNAYILLDNAKSQNGDLDIEILLSIPTDFVSLDAGYPFAGLVKGSPSNYQTGSFLMQWGGTIVQGGVNRPAFYGFVKAWMNCFDPIFQPLGTQIACRLYALNGRAYVSGSVNGNVIQSKNQTVTSFFSAPIGIFSAPYCTTNGQALGMVATPATCFILHRAKISIDASLHYDLTPVIANGEPCLLNSVTGELITNAGSGAFIPIY